METHLWFLFLLMTPLWAPAPGKAQLAPELTRSRGPACCPTIQAQTLAVQAQAVADQAQDWGEISYYHAENVKLLAQPVEKGRVVFIGDAITEPWDLANTSQASPM